MKLDDAVVMVTGAGSGIGKETAIRFAEAGANVVVADVRGEAAEAVAREVESSISIEVDVTDADAAKAAVEAITSTFGRLDVLVNNAGVSANGSALAMPEETWDHVVDTNLKSVYVMSHAAWPLLAETGGGCILNTASTAGLWAFPGNIAFCASKAGVIMLTKCMALDGAREGIRANCICPGFVQTPNLEHFLSSQPDPDEARRGAAGLHPLGRLGEPLDIAQGFVFLASDSASWVTGAALVIDGGLTLGMWRA
jgi:NAD(P)-dependent dehydrogenase (short-subunit alcohol dehydrogenase family)